MEKESKKTLMIVYDVDNKPHQAELINGIPEIVVSWILQDRLSVFDFPVRLRSSDNGDVMHYLGGKRHRLDGPAFVGCEGSTGYWVEGQPYSEQEFIDEYWKLTDFEYVSKVATALFFD